MQGANTLYTDRSLLPYIKETNLDYGIAEGQILYWNGTKWTYNANILNNK